MQEKTVTATASRWIPAQINPAYSRKPASRELTHIYSRTTLHSSTLLWHGGAQMHGEMDWCPLGSLAALAALIVQLPVVALPLPCSRSSLRQHQLQESHIKPSCLWKNYKNKRMWQNSYFATPKTFPGVQYSTGVSSSHWEITALCCRNYRSQQSFHIILISTELKKKKSFIKDDSIKNHNCFIVDDIFHPCNSRRKRVLEKIWTVSSSTLFLIS